MEDFILFLLRNLDWVLKLVFTVICVMIGWYFGGRNEKKHLTKLNQDEQNYQHIILSSERFYTINTDKDSQLVLGSVVIAQDGFKMMIALFLNIFGKDLTVYETLLVRGRREAIVRMKAQADLLGFDGVLGVRLDTSMVGVGAIEVIAYGTAFRRSS